MFSPPRWFSYSAAVFALVLIWACGEPERIPEGPAHCDLEYASPTAFSGKRKKVKAGRLRAGAAEARLNVPIGSALGAYTSRIALLGDGFYDKRDNELAYPFSPSVGIETAPRVKALALENGNDHVVILKLDLGVSYRGLVRDIELALGDDYSGKVIVATSHSHSVFGHFTGSQAFFLGFSEFRREVYEAILEDSVRVAQEAIANLDSAKIGVAYHPDFDPEDRVNRDRRSANDELAGGKQKDHHLFVVRVDTEDGKPIAMLPVFGIHGTIGHGSNMWASVDAPGYIERVLEESFDQPVVVMHLQGAAGDVSPVGSFGVNCSGRELCENYAAMESVGLKARDAILAVYEKAGESLESELPIEMMTRDVPLGPDVENLAVRDGALRYAPFDGVTIPDGEIFDEAGEIISPIDEFNAPAGAALCFESPIPLPELLLPGAQDVLAGTPYDRCIRVDALAGDEAVENLFKLKFGTPPICDTLFTTVSALRIGVTVFATLPGEPTTLLVDKLRANSPAGAEHTIVVGYAQDHTGYLLLPEDWLSGGYEPSITFWGPLEGEVIMERSLELIPLVLSEEREDAMELGVPYVRPIEEPDNLPPLDPAPRLGEVPNELPEGLLLRDGLELHSAQPSPSIERLERTSFVFIGPDPRKLTPRIRLEREVKSGEFAPVERRSGRYVEDGEILLTHTPLPLHREEGERTHYFIAEWQAVPALGEVDGLDDRFGLALGRYRFRVEMGETVIHSNAFEVRPATLEIAREADDGDDAVFRVHYRVGEGGFRLLSLEHHSSGAMPLTGAGVLTVNGASVTADGEGRVRLPLLSPGEAYVFKDRFGNEGSYTFE